MKDHRFTCVLVVRFIQIFVGCIPSFCLQAVDSGYVDAVEADVMEFTSHEFKAPVESTWVGSAEEALPGGELGSLEGFSRFLQSKTPGSHIFFRTLPKYYQEQLRSDYLLTGDLDRIKQDIFKYTQEVKNR